MVGSEERGRQIDGQFSRQGVSGEVGRAAFERRRTTHLDAVRLQAPTKAVVEY